MANTCHFTDHYEIIVSAYLNSALLMKLLDSLRSLDRALTYFMGKGRFNLASHIRGVDSPLMTRIDAHPLLAIVSSSPVMRLTLFSYY
jgi:hypothetical protein